MADRLRDAGRGARARRRRRRARRRPTSRGATTAGGSTSSCAATTRGRCSAATRARRGRSTSTRSRCSERARPSDLCAGRRRRRRRPGARRPGGTPAGSARARPGAGPRRRASRRRPCPSALGLNTRTTAGSRVALGLAERASSCSGSRSAKVHCCIGPSSAPPCADDTAASSALPEPRVRGTMATPRRRTPR